MTNALDLLDAAIADLEAKLNLAPGEQLPQSAAAAASTSSSTTASPPEKANTKEAQNKGKKQKNNKKEQQKKKNNNNNKKSSGGGTANTDQPEICKLELKVGQITKVWVHPDAEKLYCEEIDVGEDVPRQIASGLRNHYTEAEMLGQRLLVVANLKPKNLLGFKSHGMVLCAAQTLPSSETERVEFIEPPPDAPLGDIIHFDGLPPPEPFSASQVEKRKVFMKCMEDMTTTEDDDCVACWKGHKFVSKATGGVCRAKTVKGGNIR